MSGGESPPGLDAFWEVADIESSDEHPLERELGHRLDAMRRYERMVENAQDNGLDEDVDTLLRAHEREARLVAQLRHALRRWADAGNMRVAADGRLDRVDVDGGRR
jgi:hypothetical protein